MKTDPNKLRSIFSRNRAEELSADVWEQFVVPPFFDKLDFHTSRKPMIFVGGRGCGKTMLLKYVSHRSMFSQKRLRIPEEDLRHIGVYWRPDTQFASMMMNRGLEDDEWISAFNHWAALVLAEDVLQSVRSISNSHHIHSDLFNVDNVELLGANAFDNTLPRKFSSLLQELQIRTKQFVLWVNNARRLDPPVFFPGSEFVKAVIQDLQTAIAPLNKATYFAFVDEYENLPIYQQRVINTWIKHSEAPLIFSLAMKRNAFVTRQTLGDEYISDIHDFRTHDLEAYLAPDFEVFAAEILFLQLSLAQLADGPVSEEVLRDPSRLTDRRSSEYAKRVRDAAEFLFPDVSHRAIAEEIFKDAALHKKLVARAEHALTKRSANLTATVFVRKGVSQASIVAVALLHRPNLQPQQIKDELDALEAGKENKFTGTTEWIDNNFVGAVLQLYEPHSRPCPFYAGLDTFTQLSRANLRHFLELCHKSIYQMTDRSALQIFPVSTTEQAEAARQASGVFLGEVKSFGALGNRLYNFVHRIGTLFQLAHQRPTLSETEQSHFAITRGKLPLTEADEEFLKQAVKWSVLFEEQGTKKKDAADPETPDYVLNPIYAPYFHISYRKKRKLELTSEEFITLSRGTLEEVTLLLRQYGKTWGVDPLEVAGPLFEQLMTT